MEVEALIDEFEAARILGLSVKTLRDDRIRARRYPYYKVNRHVGYRASDLEAIIKASFVAPLVETRKESPNKP